MMPPGARTRMVRRITWAFLVILLLTVVWLVWTQLR